MDMDRNKLSPSANRIDRIRVLIADDHPVVREGLATMINRQLDMQVVAEAPDGHVAVEQFLLHRPDVALLDIRMPHLDGIAAMQAILFQTPDARILLLSTYDCDEQIYQGFKAGAKGFLSKDTPREDLLETIRKIHNGITYILPKVAAKLAECVARSTLSVRELEVLRLMAVGKSNKEIGVSLFITEGTVKLHVSHLLKKLKATGRTEAINLALIHGIVTLDSATH
jgi:two-component system NarL family response regulator